MTHPRCPVCRSETKVLGSLGSYLWFRCQSCGAETYVVAGPGERPAELEETELQLQEVGR